MIWFIWLFGGGTGATRDLLVILVLLVTWYWWYWCFGGGTGVVGALVLWSSAGGVALLRQLLPRCFRVPPYLLLVSS